MSTSETLLVLCNHLWLFYVCSCVFKFSSPTEWKVLRALSSLLSLCLLQSILASFILRSGYCCSLSLICSQFINMSIPLYFFQHSNTDILSHPRGRQLTLNTRLFKLEWRILIFGHLASILQKSEEAGEGY